jgi:DNA invertase Pin-like site-specific DNA recombinase
MIAAIYARKSTKDENEEKSVERQETGARPVATRIVPQGEECSRQPFRRL